MLRVLVLIAAILFIRELLPRKQRRSPTGVSPYQNGLDGLLLTERVQLDWEPPPPDGATGD